MLILLRNSKNVGQREVCTYVSENLNKLCLIVVSDRKGGLFASSNPYTLSLGLNYPAANVGYGVFLTLLRRPEPFTINDKGQHNLRYAVL
jgi:hypothetical protein